MSGRRLSRLRSEGLGVKAVAKLVAVTVLLCLLVVCFTATTHRSMQPASANPVPAQRRLVTLASGEQSSVQAEPRPAAPGSGSPVSSSQETIHLSAGASQADQPSLQLSDSTAQDSWASSVSVAAPGEQADPVPKLSAPLLSAGASPAPSGSSEPSRSDAAADQLADASVRPAAEAALSAQDSPVVAAPSPVSAVPHSASVSMPKRRSRVRIGAAAAAPNAMPLKRSRRVTPEKRLRAFEWLFGPKERRPPPTLSPVATAAVEHDPACAAFYRRHPDGPKTVAVVGNGPLSDADRDHINSPTMDIVMRFNRLNNWACSDRIDIWMNRQAGDRVAPLLWHGLGTTQCPTEVALAAAPFLLFLGEDNQGEFNDLLLVPAVAAYPELFPLPRVGISHNAWVKLFRSWIVSTAVPTTGWVGMVLALQCVPHDTEVHLFGYNWTSEKQFKAHRLAFEERYAALMAAAGRVVVHPPPCGRLRQCDPRLEPPDSAGVSDPPSLWGPMGGDSLAADDDGVHAQNGDPDGANDDDVEAQ